MLVGDFLLGSFVVTAKPISGFLVVWGWCMYVQYKYSTSLVIWGGSVQRHGMDLEWKPQGCWLLWGQETLLGGTLTMRIVGE